MLGIACPHGCGRLDGTKEEALALLKNLPYGASLAAGMEKLAAYIAEEAEAGAKKAVPQIRTEVRDEVRPYVIAAIGVSVVGGGLGLAAFMRNRQRGLRGLDGWTYCERKVASKGRFDPRSFRWKASGKGRVLIGCPKGHWKPRAKHCDVGTVAYKVLSPSPGRCGTDERSLNKFTAFFSR